MLSFGIVLEQPAVTANNHQSPIILSPLSDSIQTQSQQHQQQQATAGTDNRLERLQSRLARLDKGTLPEYQRCKAELEAECQDRQQAARDWYNLRCELINKEHAAEKHSAQRELESRKKELTDLLLAELKEKRRAVEVERASFDLNFDGDVHDVKQPATWRLRNRQPAKVSAAAAAAKEAVGQVDTGSSASGAGGSGVSAASAAAAALLAVAASGDPCSGGISAATAAAAGVASSTSTGASTAAVGGLGSIGAPLWGVGGAFDPLLPDSDIQEDLRIIAKARQRVASTSTTSSSGLTAAGGAAGGAAASGATAGASGVSGTTSASQLQVVDGVLYYRDRSFGRGVQVSLETRRAPRCCGMIVNVSQQEVIIKRSSDGAKIKVSLKHLRSGKFVLKRIPNR
uniref:Sin3 histone deacetylase corepressor complex component sds3 n=2 Tax=Macrostomum lignano TaxID=282301 RepID=A0A1I8HIT3_9PLAT